MSDDSPTHSLTGRTVRDSAGTEIGTVGRVYLDEESARPEWVTVTTGLSGTRETLAPLAVGRLEGDELILEVTKDQVSAAPVVEEGGRLSVRGEAELYRYYGLTADHHIDFSTGGSPGPGDPDLDL